MALRSASAADLVRLPVLDAHGTVALATALEAAVEPALVAARGAAEASDTPTATATGSKRGAPTAKAATTAPSLSRLLLSSVAAITTAREALQAELAKTSAPPTDVASADVEEDLAVGALYDVLKAWARLAGRTKEGDAAASLLQLLGGPSYRFVQIRPDKEWSEVETRLTTLGGAAAAKLIDTVGAKPALEHLRAVHVDYTAAVQSKALETAESPRVRALREDLSETIRAYVLRCAGAVDPAIAWTATLTAKLLAPYENAAPTPRAKKPAPPPAAG